MRRVSALVAALLPLLASGCGARAEEMGDARYRIPAENLQSNTFAAEYVRFVYGNVVPDDPQELGLVFTGKEVAEAIAGFRAMVPGYVGL